MTEVLHIINLDTVGGVEELFVHFLKDAPGKHHILVAGGKIHPHFKEIVTSKASSITYEKFFLGFKIPKALSFLRKLKRHLAAKKRAIKRVVLWNKIVEVSELKKLAQEDRVIIYYEHGASWIEKKKLKTASFFSAVDAIIANSFAAKRVLELKWEVKKPISVIDNPLRPDLAIQVQARKTPTSPFQIGYIGRLIPLKAVSLTLHAAQELKRRKIPIQLKIAGSGEEKAQLIQEAEKLHISDRVQFVGIIDNVENFYDSIDLLVVPSIREPLGLVALEASSRGCPVIAAKVDGLPEVVKDNENGFLLSPTLSIADYPQYGGRVEKLPDLVYNPAADTLEEPRLLDPIEIANKIEQLINDKDEYQKLSANALRKANERIKFDEYIRRLYETFVSKSI